MNRAERKGDLVGSILEGAYRVTRLIGEGGMGAVYEAVQLRLNKRVAVKLMSRELAANSEALARFRREAEITSLIGHAHLVTIIDFGTAESGEPYLVMEYLDGEDLEHRLERAGRLPVDSVVHIVRQVASALSATHSQGVVHRDLKPANVFLLQMAGEPDFVKVLDFGISKMKAARTKLTRALSILGTPNYMSPEQATGMVDEIDHRTDQWALACIAWEMLSGRPPFVAEELSALLYQVINLDPQPLSKRVAKLPPEVEPVLRRALSKQMGNRYSSITDFSRAFEMAALGHSADATPPPVLLSGTRDTKDAVSGTAPTVAGGTVTDDERPESRRHLGNNAAAQVTTFSQTAGEQANVWPLRRLKRVHVIAVVLGLVLIGGGVLLLRPRAGQPTAMPKGAPAAPSVPVVAPLPSPAVTRALPPVLVPKAKPLARPIEADGKTDTSTKPKSPKKHVKRYLIQEL